MSIVNLIERTKILGGEIWVLTDSDLMICKKDKTLIDIEISDFDFLKIKQRFSMASLVLFERDKTLKVLKHRLALKD